VPLRREFTYQTTLPAPPIGCRVKVPFGSRELIGVVSANLENTPLTETDLKSVIEVIDTQPIFTDPNLWTLLIKASHYYHHSLGDVLATALPNALIKGKPAKLEPQKTWQVTELGKTDYATIPARAVRQRQAMQYFIEAANPVSSEELNIQDISASTLRSLANKGWINAQYLSETPAKVTVGQSLTLNDQQRTAVDAINDYQNCFKTLLIDGVTGSGKTEVYLQAIAKQIELGRQVLILIPEIGLTPQTVQRFEQRFANQVGVLHSGLTDGQRLTTWLKAREGILKIIIGTRSAIFTPMKTLGMIIVDEEHDLSFKQQDGLKYSSRDLAILRGQLTNIPVILGSATPSLESLQNALNDRYKHLILTHRASGHPPPALTLLDCKNQPLIEGFSQPLLQAIERHLADQQQVLVFINRRGFAPILMCHKCGWIADCKRCDSYLTLHQGASHSYLQCHHCGHYQKHPDHCPKCHEKELISVGQGTERIEQFLAKRFPDYPIQRIDRDTTRRKQAMSQYIEAAKSGSTRLLVGTQMIAKGHHFPKVTLVAVLDIDGALFSSDFRAPERAAQLLVQVAGRAGRELTQGEVMIQTHHPDHPLLRSLTHLNYQQVAKTLLQERAASLLPPHTHMALIRAESHNKQQALDFLSAAQERLNATNSQLELLGPVACAISRKAGRYRFQLLINATRRSELHPAISQVLPDIENLPLASRVRWSLDIDPQDLL